MPVMHTVHAYIIGCAGCQLDVAGLENCMQGASAPLSQVLQDDKAAG